MYNVNVFCFGFGQVAKNFINKLKLENFNVNLSTTSRKKTHTKKINNINYTSFQFNEDNYDIKLIEKLKKSNYILVSIPPSEGTDLVVKNFSEIIENSEVKWITYLSATSVYGDHEGSWVNEESVLNPTTPNGLNRISAEKLWLSLCSVKKLPLQIFRLSGIYSNENNILFRLKSGNVKIVKKKNHFFSRVHVEDIANILFKSL
ncbi:oxidoreductase, partial [Candidatus Pelagibacter sp.]|nr:oxidoreductase [Candidatus Pelagibacter sp.]